MPWPSSQRSDVFRLVHTQRPSVLDSIIAYLQTLSPALVCATVFSIAFIGTVFPPSPSDLIIVVLVLILTARSLHRRKAGRTGQ
jgi:hypothetical protein